MKSFSHRAFVFERRKNSRISGLLTFGKNFRLLRPTALCIFFVVTR
jgi:hypothetical protein